MDWVNALTGNNWLFIKVFITILFAGLLSLCVNKYILILIKNFDEKHSSYKEIILVSLRKPLRSSIWIIGFYWSFLFLGFNEALIYKIRSVLLLVMFVWFMIRFISGFESSLEVKVEKGEVKFNKTTLKAISQLLRVAVLVTSSLIGLQVFGVPVSGVLAFGGIGGIGVAFAAKDLLSNFFGGLMIYLDRPFEVGDWIRSPDKDIEGTVEDIGWRLTAIRTFDQRLRYVPNNLFSLITVDNPSRMRNRRIKTLVGLRYEDAGKMQVILNDIKLMLQNHQDIDSRRTMLVNFTEFGPSSLNIQIYTFTKTIDWAEYLNVQQDVYLKIINIINEHKAECAFPTRTLHMVGQAEEGAS